MKSTEWFAVYYKGEPRVAYPRKIQAEIYLSGFSTPEECDIRSLHMNAMSAMDEQNFKIEVGNLARQIQDDDQGGCDWNVDEKSRALWDIVLKMTGHR